MQVRCIIPSAILPSFLERVHTQLCNWPEGKMDASTSWESNGSSWSQNCHAWAVNNVLVEQIHHYTIAPTKPIEYLDILVYEQYFGFGVAFFVLACCPQDQPN